MMRIISWTLWQKRWAIFWWNLGIIFFIFLTLIFYPTIHHQSSQLNQSFSQLPKTAKQLFTDTTDIFSPIGYLSSQVFYLMFPLLIGILAINQGMGLIGKEEKDNTIEMLLARPISRGRLLVVKALAGLLIVGFVGALGTFFIGLMCKLTGLAVPVPNILEAGVAVIMMSLCLGAIALMLTALGRTGRAASIGISALVALGGYVVVSLVPSVDWLRWPAKVFPFNYYHSAELLRGTYHWSDAAFFVAVSVGCMIISLIAFRRRDLESI